MFVFFFTRKGYKDLINTQEKHYNLLLKQFNEVKLENQKLMLEKANYRNKQIELSAENSKLHKENLEKKHENLFLKWRLQNPPKFKKGDKLGPFKIILVQPIKKNIFDYNVILLTNLFLKNKIKVEPYYYQYTIESANGKLQQTGTEEEILEMIKNLSAQTAKTKKA